MSFFIRRTKSLLSTTLNMSKILNYLILNNVVRKNMYIKVFGTIRLYKEEKAIVGNHIKKVEKYDEVVNHFLQAFVASQTRQKGVLTVRC
jgi:hypothetical protein